MQHYKLLTLLTISAFMPKTALADGQSVPINYDNISFFEEPLAIEIGPATLSTNALIDQAVRYNSTTDDDTYNTRLSADITLEAELPTSAQIALNYVANYDRLADKRPAIGFAPHYRKHRPR